MVSLRTTVLLVAAVLTACKDDPTTGTLVVDVTGLPSGAPAAVVVSGTGLTRPITATTTLEKLPPGDYTVRVQAVTFAQGLYTTTATQTKYTIAAGETAVAPVSYALSSGVVDLAIAGLPANTSALVQLAGPNGHSRTVSASGIVGALPAGQYEIRADTATSPEGDRFGALSYLQSVTVPVSLTPVQAAVTYRLSSGTIALTVSGLPGVPDPLPVTVSGPGNFLRRTATSATYRGLAPGTYAISAGTHHETCPLAYTPSATQQIVNVGEAATESRTVTYSETQVPPQSLNLRIEAMHLTQATQTLDGSVPTVAGRAAMLRVFGIANESNLVLPKVRVTLSNGTVYTINASEAYVRTSLQEGILSASWNVLIPAAAVRPGLRAVAEIDPENRYCESDDADNRRPATGEFAFDIRSMPPIGIRFVPVLVSAGNHLGNVTEQNVDAFLDFSRRIHPVDTYVPDVRVPYTTTRLAFQSNDGNGSWSGVLSEISALRQAEGSNRYYHGIVRVTYGGGQAGIGQLGGKAALSWDFLPSGSEIVAHELGHNYARFHAPCGGAGGPDSRYPYALGDIGVVGYDPIEAALKSPATFSDIMGYCRPYWISDYSFVAMMNWLADPARGSTLPGVGEPAEQPALLVWGRILNGVPVLEPAYEIRSRASLPAPGPHRLAIRDAAGNELIDVSFAGERIADLPGEQETFAFTVPLAALRGATPGSLELNALGGRTVSVRAAESLAADPGTVVTRAANGTARVRWDATRFPGIMVRDPRTGDVLSFATGGDVTVRAQGDLELHYSNRVGSGRRLVRLR